MGFGERAVRSAVVDRRNEHLDGAGAVAEVILMRQSSG